MAVLPSVPLTDDDPKCQPGAYVRLGDNLYYILEYQDGAAACENCRTDAKVRLSPQNLERAILVQAAPTVPDVIPDGG